MTTVEQQTQRAIRPVVSETPADLPAPRQAPQEAAEPAGGQPL